MNIFIILVTFFYFVSITQLISKQSENVSTLLIKETLDDNNSIISITKKLLQNDETRVKISNLRGSLYSRIMRNNTKDIENIRKLKQIVEELSIDDVKNKTRNITIITSDNISTTNTNTDSIIIIDSNSTNDSAFIEHDDNYRIIPCHFNVVSCEDRQRSFLQGQFDYYSGLSWSIMILILLIMIIIIFYIFVLHRIVLNCIRSIQLIYILYPH